MNLSISAVMQQKFEIAYWPEHGPPWNRFATVEAASAKDAIEAVDPQAGGRYRVTLAGSEETAGLFRIYVTPNGCELVEVDAFHSGPSARQAEADKAADAAAGFWRTSARRMLSRQGPNHH